MNTISQLSPLVVTGHAQDPFCQARQIWDAFTKEMHLLPTHLRKAALEYVNEREYKLITQPPLNLIVPVLLADVFGVVDPMVIEKVTLAHLSLDQASHLIDDATDCSLRVSPLQLHLSQLLISKSTTSFLSLSSHPETASQWLCRYLTDAMTAERELWRHHSVIMEYSDTDYKCLAQRGGLIRACAAMYADITDRWHLLPSVERGLLDAAIAVQLMDDILDWHEDLHTNIYTEPLVATLRQIDLETAMRNPEAVPRAIIISAVADDVIEYATNSLDNAAKHFAAVNARGLVALASSLSGSLRSVFHTFAIARTGTMRIRSYRTLLRSTVDVRMQH